ncbi:MAG: hypothetical protein ACFE9N_03555 [Promethearchaeota archaeon]
MTNIVFRKHKNRAMLKVVVLILFIFSINQIQFSDFSIEDNGSIENFGNNKEILTSQGPGNDTTAPIITFIQPSTNNTVISFYSFTIVANVSDENPPSYGNVTISISNYTNVLFVAKMNNTGGDLWSFNWDNITQYPNYQDYILQVWAKDSYENSNWSVGFYVFINIVPEIPILNLIFYFIMVAAIFLGIIYYINKKRLHTLSKSKKNNLQN